MPLLPWGIGTIMDILQIWEMGFRTKSEFLVIMQSGGFCVCGVQTCWSAVNSEYISLCFGV